MTTTQCTWLSLPDYRQIDRPMFAEAPVAPAAVRVGATDYINAHGRMPSGAGAWVFKVERRVDCGVALLFINGSLMFAEAKKLARAEAAKGGWRFLMVQG
jgi:hypothetical protein